MSKSSARAGSPIAEPAEWFDAVVDARYGKGVRDEILADAERAFRTHFDDDKNRKAENVVWRDGPDGKKIPFLDGWISPEMGAWQGEFWGKYMLAGAEVAECRNDAELKRWLAGNAVRFVREFRQSDGYIGSYADRDFLVPKGGYARPPVNRMDNAATGQVFPSGAAGGAINVLPESPMAKASGTWIVPLVYVKDSKSSKPVCQLANLPLSELPNERSRFLVTTDYAWDYADVDGKAESDWTAVEPGFDGAVAGVAVKLVGRPPGTVVVVR